MLSLNHVELLKYIMNNNPSTLNEVSNHFNKSAHFIRTEIQSIDNFLDISYSITVKNATISTNITYKDFIKIMKSLNFDNYLTTQQERISIIIIKSFFEEYCNLSRLYQSWNLSLTTKKRDMQKLEEYVSTFGLKVTKKPGTGIKIVGDILHYRMLIIRILIFSCDVSQYHLIRREANTPIENMNYDIFMNAVKDNSLKAETMISEFLSEYEYDINYYSKKFFICYILLALTKSEFNTVHPLDLKLQALNFYLFQDSFENRAFNQVASMIDFSPSASIPYNKRLYEEVVNLYDGVLKDLNLQIKTHDEVIKELYLYIYRQYFHEHFHFIYEDKLVKRVDRYYPDILKSLRDRLSTLEDLLSFKFHDEHLTSLTLIISKWTLKNRFYGSKKLKIVLVTNVAYERVNYFVQALHENIEFDLVTTLDINEIDVLKSLNFDHILSFSNRISNVLKNNGYDSLKVNFFLTNEDLLSLRNLGFETPKFLIDTDSFLELLNETPPEMRAQILKDHYSDIFI